jgi:hypothetical protein
VAAGVYVVVQLAVEPLTLESVHGVGLKTPLDGEDEKPTVPVGVLAVPPSVSVTVAVHVVPTATSTDEGTQEIAVVVVRVLTDSVTEPLLTAWAPSPP